MDDLVQWLRAQLDEDERIARATDKTLAQGHLRWGAQPVDDAFSRVLTGRGGVVGTGEFKPEDAEHIAEWDPARVLREIDAKRRIVVEYHYAASLPDGAPLNECGTCGAANEAWPCPTLRLLALPYADRPGYRKEWRP